MTIYRTAPTSNFTPVSNSLIANTSLSSNARLILLYLISKPPSWQVRITDLKRVIGIGRDRIYKCLAELRAAGYAVMTRLQRGVRWSFYDTPQTPDKPEPKSRLPEIQCTERPEALVKIEILEKKETTTQEPSRNNQTTVKSVVVSVQEEKPPIPLPDSIKPSQQRAANKILNTVTPEQAALILVVFNAALTSKKINNPIGYLHALTTAAKNGSLSPITGHQPTTLNERIAKERERREEAAKRAKVDNESFFNMLVRKYGYAVPQ